MLPYSGPIGYNAIRGEFGSPGNFTLQNAYNGNYGSLNTYSYIQPTNTGGVNYSPTNWYGYDGQYIVTDQLLLNWDAWPTIGSYPGFGTTVTNTVGGFNGTLINGTGWTNSAGNGGGAFTFDGGDDYIGSTNGPTGYGEFSVECWFKVQTSFAIGALAGQSIYNLDNWSTSNMWLLHPNGTAATTSITFYIGSVGGIKSVNSTNLTQGNWYQVVGTYSATNTNIYVNGTLNGQGAGGPPVINVPPNTLVLGGDPRINFRRLTGNISVLNIYNKELSATEVSQNWGAYRGRYLL
jgi:hypothetical protein